MYRRRRPELAEPMTATAHDLGTGLSSLMFREQDQQLVADAMSDLELDDAILLLLYHQEHLTGPELSHVFGAPEGTIRGRLSAALKRLKEAFQRRHDAGVGPHGASVDRAEWLRQMQAELEPHLQRLKLPDTDPQ